MTQPAKNDIASFSRPDTWWSLLSEEEKSSIMDSYIKNKVSEEYSPKKVVVDKSYVETMNNFPNKSFYQLAAKELGLDNHDTEKDLKEQKKLLLLKNAVEWWTQVTPAAKKEMCFEAFDSSDFVENLSEKAVVFLYENYSHKLVVGNAQIFATHLPEDTHHSQVM